ncbi:MAG TPA: c-type cytochrome [Burkholderiaceae bacterium]|nr:c-type cytochrome [Burkholderiaceae bacterium]
MRGAAVWVLAALCSGAALAQPGSERLAVCGGCHGSNGQSVITGTPSLAGQPKVFIENQLVIMREGLRDVPAMKPFVADLKDADISALATHYAALPARGAAAPTQADKAKAGAALAQRLLCNTCHLPDYAGQQQVPRLAAQDETYLAQSMKQFRDHPGPGRDTIMAATLRGLTDDELAQLAHFLAHFKP